MITLIDFKCNHCNHKWEHCFTKKDDIVNALECPECSHVAFREWHNVNFIHPSKSSMYGRYEPCFGEYVENRSHKQKLLKKYGVTESSDPVGGSRCYRTTDHAPALSALDRDIEILPGTSNGSVPKVEWTSLPDDTRE